MKHELNLAVAPDIASGNDSIKALIAAELRCPPSAITFFKILKRSVDARSRSIKINLKIEAYTNETPPPPREYSFRFPPVQDKRPVIIVGAGPAGLFAALQLIEKGLKPVIIERGKDVKSRRRDLAAINKAHIVNPDSNYCFGEGGAGTYSDGKLYTRSTKRGDVTRVLELFVAHGADENILVEAHPHIGTNKLPKIIQAMRQTILDHGGEVHFETRVTDLIIRGNAVKGVTCSDLENDTTLEFMADQVILATGHSARDIFELLHKKNILIEGKTFAMGVRVEHPQALIDSLQYHCSISDVPKKRDYLPAASYSLVHQAMGRGVYSFCMCPGGIIAPASTAPDELVVNGWSPSKRNNPYANSGIVVSVEEKDLSAFRKHGPLAGIYFQQSVERKAFQYGGGKFVAPAQRMADFVEGKTSSSLPSCSYVPGIHAAPLQQVLPSFVYNSLRQAFPLFGEKMKGYFTNEAVLVATESRTSSPVRIPRDTHSLRHPQISNLYPCGEGAGYAGGIVSAAMDGERVADKID